MADVAKRIVTVNNPGVTTLTTASQDLYPTPTTGAGTVIRSIHVCNISGNVATFNLAISRGTTNLADTGANCLFWQVPVSPGLPFDWSGFIHLGFSGTSADILRGLASANSALTITVSGVEL